MWWFDKCPQDCCLGGDLWHGMHDWLYVGGQSECQRGCASSLCQKVITRVDLDGPVLCSEDPIDGGAVFNEKEITVSDAPGLGIKGIRGLTYLDV